MHPKKIFYIIVPLFSVLVALLLVELALVVFYPVYHSIESNMVFGLVYVSERKGYYYHAWVATFAEHLYFVDPALGKNPASTGYIPLVIDDDGTNIIHLAGLIDRITISHQPTK